MIIRTTSPTSENYVDALCDAADVIKLRAKEIVGDIDGQRSISVTIKMEPGEIITIDVFKSFVSSYQRCSGRPNYSELMGIAPTGRKTDNE